MARVYSEPTTDEETGQRRSPGRVQISKTSPNGTIVVTWRSGADVLKERK
jgi:hypothetical protein